MSLGCISICHKFHLIHRIHSADAEGEPRDRQFAGNPHLNGSPQVSQRAVSPMWCWLILNPESSIGESLQTAILKCVPLCEIPPWIASSNHIASQHHSLLIEWKGNALHLLYCSLEANVFWLHTHDLQLPINCTPTSYMGCAILRFR